MSNHIKIQGTSPRIQYVADGKINAYEFPFVIFNPSDINVYLNDKVQDLNTYTVTMSQNTEGGEVSFETAPASGTIITIVRNLAIKRTTTFQEGGALRTKVLNNEFDYQMACQQQIADSLNRSMVLPPYAVDTDVDLTLPTPSAGKAIVWNKDATNLENSAVKINELESTLKGYKESAESSATIATEKASIASDKADIATTQAGIATQKAEEAIASIDNKTNVDFSNVNEDNAHKLIGNRVWVSGEYEPKTATRTIVTHNLNLENPLYARGEVLLKCISDEAGYTAGEFCSNWTPSGVNNNYAFPINSGVSLTQNTIETTTGADTLAALNKNSSNGYFFLSHSKWRYVFRIFY